jgi:predicted HAD superfamily phosphohydrolase YqeG
MSRILYALKKAWVNSSLLNSYLYDRNRKIFSLDEITAKKLDARHVAVLVLDFDGVLAPHGDIAPLPEALVWLKQIALDLGEQRIVILTNKPMKSRIEFFRRNYPGIDLIQGSRKKPYPDGLETISLQKGVPTYRLMLVDDRLLTGILATVIAKSQGCYFINPYKSFKNRPFSELFFAGLRFSEKILVKCFNFLRGIFL